MYAPTFPIRRNGSFEFEMLAELQGPGSRVSVDFSRKLLHELVKIGAKCMEAIDEHQLTQGERSMYSALYAAANSITRAHFSELPMTRVIKSAQENSRPKKHAEASAKHINSSGRVDLWCQWKNVQFLIELKRTAIGLNQMCKRNGLHNSWKSVTEQVTAVKPDFTNWCEKGATIGVLCVCPYSQYSYAPKRQDWTERGNNIRAELLALQPQPSFLAVWNLASNRWTNERENQNGSLVNEVVPICSKP